MVSGSTQARQQIVRMMRFRGKSVLVRLPKEDGFTDISECGTSEESRCCELSGIDVSDGPSLDTDPPRLPN